MGGAAPPRKTKAFASGAAEKKETETETAPGQSEPSEDTEVIDSIPSTNAVKAKTETISWSAQPVDDDEDDELFGTTKKKGKKKVTKAKAKKKSMFADSDSDDAMTSKPKSKAAMSFFD